MFGKNKKEQQTTEGQADKTEEPASKPESDPAEKEQPKQKEADDKKSSTSSESEEVELTPEDIKKIKDLIKEQDETIEKKVQEIEKLEKAVKDLKQKLAYQVAENDNTVKRYRKQIEEGKQFAISKFAKELLDVRDSLELALKHCNKDAIEGISDMEQIKDLYRNICKGQEMTSEVMDKILSKFDVVQFEPLGEKFDPNIHEAVFVIPQSEHEDNHVGVVMQSGWKIGERVLRAAKVGIVKK